MKRSDDPRHLKRQAIVKNLYAKVVNPSTPPLPTTVKILPHLKAIDQLIIKCAPEWPLSQINRVDLSILRLAIYELKFTSQTPPKVVIDEAVELAKTYGSEASPGFINGALGSVLKTISKP
jgi:transcription antitermination protein NusB